MGRVCGVRGGAVYIEAHSATASHLPSGPSPASTSQDREDEGQSISHILGEYFGLV